MSPTTPHAKEASIPEQLPIRHAARRLGVSGERLRGMMIAFGIHAQMASYGNARMISRADFLLLSESLEQYGTAKAGA